MKLWRKLILILGVLWLTAAYVFAQGNYKAEAIGVAPAEVPEALRNALQPAGARLLNDQGAAVCELWLLNSVSTQSSSGGSADTLYPALVSGTLVGVLRFPNGGSDFRGQKIKAGIYTMRYANIPQDGNHMGVSTYRDFLLLGPVAADTETDKALSFDALVKLSRLASGSGHPAILSLGPPTETKVVPAVFQDDLGHWVLQVSVPGSSQRFQMGIILVGKAET